MNHGIALPIWYLIEEACKDNTVTLVFKLMVTNRNRFKLLGIEVEECIHATKLKDRIVDLFQDMEAHKQGQNVVLISNTDFGSALSS